MEKSSNIKPRGEIPKHIMDGVLEGVEKEKPKVEHKEEMMTTQIPKAEPVKKTPKVEIYYEETRISKHKKAKGDSVDPEKLQRLLDKSKVKEQKKEKIPEGSVQSNSITKKKLEAIEKILELKETGETEIKVEPIDWKKTETKGAQNLSHEQRNESKIRSLFSKLNFKNVKSVLPYIGLLLVFIIIFSSVIQFKSVVGNVVRGDINQEPNNNTNNETAEATADNVALTDNIRDIGSRFKNFLSKAFLGGINSEQESSEADNTTDSAETQNQTETINQTGLNQTKVDEITTQEAVDYIKQKLLAALK